MQGVLGAPGYSCLQHQTTDVNRASSAAEGEQGATAEVTHLPKPASRTESSSGETSLSSGERKDEVVHKTHRQRSSSDCQRFRRLQGMGLLPGGYQGPATHPSIRAGEAQCPLYSTGTKKWCFSRVRAI